MKRFILLFLSLLFVFMAFGCDGDKFVDNKQYTIELGSEFKSNVSSGVNLTVTGPDGEKVTTKYGSFKPKAVGQYTAVFEKDGKSQTVTVWCVDTSAPVINVVVDRQSYLEGEELEVPYYVVNDYSKITKQYIKVTKNGVDVTLNEGKWIGESGVYKLNFYAKDEWGNVCDKVIDYNVRTTYIDENVDSNTLFTFDNQEYQNLVYQPNGVESFNYEITKTDYPTIKDDKEGNGVLHLYTDYNYGDVSITLTLNTGFVLTKAEMVYIKVCADRNCDYVKVISPLGKEVASVNTLRKGEWRTIEVDPVVYGIGYEFKDFVIVSRADEGLNLWIDDITYTDRWVDDTLADGYIADFDDEGYVSLMDQNTLAGIYFASGGVGSVFSIIDWIDYNTQEPVKAMKIETKVDKGGFTFMFPYFINVSEIESITLNIDVEYKCLNLWVGFIGSDFKSSKSSGVQEWYDTSVYSICPWNGGFDNNAKRIGCEKLVIPASAMETDTVTGMYIGIRDNVRIGNVMYIDSITVQYKE